MTRRGAQPAPAWLHADVLARVWGLVAQGLERRSLAPRGRVDVPGLTREERHALTDVLGTPVTAEVIRLDLAQLDERLGRRTGLGLVEVVAALVGRPLVDRSARRREAAHRREEPFEAAHAWVARRLGVDGGGAPAWVGAWLEGLRRDGLLSVGDGVRLVTTALDVLAACGALGPGDGGDRTRSRTDLAARVTGSSHGLDDDTRLALLVLRAAAARADSRLPRGAAARRTLWETLGVVTDRVSTTCLTWGLRLGGERDSSAREAPVVRHLTWWELDREDGPDASRVVLVCENPRTLEALAEREPAGVGVVCTMGRPNLVVREVLQRLATAGTELYYHGDFDWPGITLANACVRDFGAVPWLMSATDYERGHGSEPLKGLTVESDWDPELGPAMRARGVAVHEEALLPQLLDRVGELSR